MDFQSQYRILREMAIQKFTAELQAIDEFYISSFPESTVRGGIGYAFKEALCLTKVKKCADCIISRNCPYFYLFETNLPENSRIMRKYDKIPHPFVISFKPSKLVQENDMLYLEFTLVGKAIDYLPYFVLGLIRLGELGLGKERGRFIVNSVRVSDCNKTVYVKDKEHISTDFSIAKPFQNYSFSNKENTILDFISPARIKFNNSYNHDLQFSVLIRNLLRRITNLAYFHSDCCIQRLDFNGIIKASKVVRTLRSNLKWSEYERYSTRQNQHMRLGGYIGEIEYKGEIGNFMPLIRSGELLHVGKATSFGMGKYIIIS